MPLVYHSPNEQIDDLACFEEEDASVPQKI